MKTALIAIAFVTLLATSVILYTQEQQKPNLQKGIHLHHIGDEIKHEADKIGHDIKHEGDKIGHDIKHEGDKIGHDISKAGKDIGHEAKNLAERIAKAKDVFQHAFKGIRKVYKDLKAAEPTIKKLVEEAKRIYQIVEANNPEDIIKCIEDIKTAATQCISAFSEDGLNVIGDVKCLIDLFHLKDCKVIYKDIKEIVSH